MHYSDGTEVLLGDTFELAGGPSEHYDGGLRAGERAIAITLHPGTDTCNVGGVVLRAFKPETFYGAVAVVGSEAKILAAACQFTGTSRAFKLVHRGS
jgi:hypothetical protein